MNPPQISFRGLFDNPQLAQFHLGVEIEVGVGVEVKVGEGVRVGAVGVKVGEGVV